MISHGQFVLAIQTFVIEFAKANDLSTEDVAHALADILAELAVADHQPLDNLLRIVTNYYGIHLKDHVCVPEEASPDPEQN